jgi:cyclase
VGDAERLLEAGADKIAINTAAIRTPHLLGELAARFGSQAIVVAVDAKRRFLPEGPPTWDGTWEVYSHGGRTPEGLDVIAWCMRVAELGAGELLLTSMDRDGTGQGYDTELVHTVATSVTIPVIASGGVGVLEHLAGGLEAGADAVLAASIFHFGQHTIPEAKAFLAGRGIGSPVGDLSPRPSQRRREIGFTRYVGDAVRRDAGTVSERGRPT